MNLLSKLFKPKVIDCPFPEKTEAKRAKVVFDKDVLWYYGRPFRQTETKDGFEMSLCDVLPGHIEDMTETDKGQIQYYQLKTDKYMQVKYAWCRGVSVRQFVQEMKNKPGFSKTLITKYFAAINRANPSPGAVNIE